ncbi:hypothetical protein DRQ19_03415 [bacterium]|nr:MAG: hypothetical protein DRQ19_03415 [bacterium]
MAKEGVPLLIALFFFLVATVVAYYFYPHFLLVGFGGLVFILLVFTAVFFREPHPGPVNVPENVLVSPCDGEVVAVNKILYNDFVGLDAFVIRIYIPLLAPHIIRVPTSARIKFIDLRRGEFFPFRNKKALFENECLSVGFMNASEDKCIVRQIAGPFTKRLSCRRMIGDFLRAGEVYGMIFFGSMVEVYLPRYCAPFVKKGMTVKGGQTVIARFK